MAPCGRARSENGRIALSGTRSPDGPPIGERDLSHISALFKRYAATSPDSLTESEFLSLLQSANRYVQRDDAMPLFSFLDVDGDHNLNYMEFVHWWLADTPPNVSLRQSNSVFDLKDTIGVENDIFFGFPYSQWCQSAGLDVRRIYSWSPSDVTLYIASHPKMSVVRDYLKSKAFRYLHGSVFLRSTEDTLLELGVHAKDVPVFLEEIERLKDISMPQKKKNITYKKGQLIGAGTSGKVYQALEDTTGRLIAVKEIEFEQKQKKKILQLLKEIDLLSTLRHPHIVEYLGTSISDGMYCLFTEWIPGGSLAGIVAKFGALEETTISLYTNQLLQGLAYLHDMKVIHGDIKGANILVDTQGVIKLADFGASTRFDPRQNGEVGLTGTPYWMAPEVFLGMSMTPQSDLWSVGCTVLEMVLGQPPWKAQGVSSFLQLKALLASEQSPDLPEGCSAKLQSFLSKCLLYQPSERLSPKLLLQHKFAMVRSDSV